MLDKNQSSLCAEILPPHGWEAGRFLEAQTRDGKREHTQIHTPFVTARQKGVLARPAATWAAQRKQSVHQKGLFIFFAGLIAQIQ